jgi:hypothetical protein
MGPYEGPIIHRAPFSLGKFSIFCPLLVFDLIAQIEAELFRFNCGVSHFYAAWHFDELSKEYLLGSEIPTILVL